MLAVFIAIQGQSSESLRRSHSLKPMAAALSRSWSCRSSPGVYLTTLCRKSQRAKTQYSQFWAETKINRGVYSQKVQSPPCTAYLGHWGGQCPDAAKDRMGLCPFQHGMMLAFTQIAKCCGACVPNLCFNVANNLLVN